MKKYIGLLLFQLILLVAHGQQISVKSFRALPTDMEARIHSPKMDQNGDVCAIIKVVTTETGFEWDGGSLGIVAAIKKTGEYWVYLPYGAKKLTIKHPKLGVLREYLYPEPIVAASVYEMVLTTAKVITQVMNEDVKSFLQVIDSEPSGADIYIDEQHVGQTPLSYNLAEGRHSFRVEKDGYHPHSSLLRVNATTQLPKVELKRILKKYSFTVNSSPVGANLYVDDKLRGKTPIDITEEEGEHQIKISLDTYLDQYPNITLDKNLGLIEFTLRPVDLDKRKVRYRTQSYVWLGAALVTTAGGFVFRSKANSNYSMYQSATNSDEATSLHNTITSQDKIAVACWASAVVCTVPLIIYRLKLRKLQKQFNLAAVPVQGGAVIGFSASF